MGTGGSSDIGGQFATGSGNSVTALRAAVVEEAVLGFVTMEDVLEDILEELVGPAA
ncbi:hypothetical protein ABCR94_36025 [Streptomyces sp. 21So2-11]|uniref:hypothetical protein n=1 Tax=Streptomyces sp. 21So2-11 TaxID=3144408 RepID=UPI00321B3D63